VLALDWPKSDLLSDLMAELSDSTRNTRFFVALVHEWKAFFGGVDNRPRLVDLDTLLSMLQEFIAGMHACCGSMITVAGGCAFAHSVWGVFLSTCNTKRFNQ
jgi:hypothetical protein